MEQINLYLKKFKNFKPKNEDLKKTIIKIIKKITKIEVKKDEIIILKSGEVKIKKTGPEKTEIYLNKKIIEKEIEIEKKLFN